MRLEFDMSELRPVIDAAQASDRRVRGAVAVAFSRVVSGVRDAEQAEMADVFDRPRPYTLSALYTKASNASGQFSRLRSDAAGNAYAVLLGEVTGEVTAEVGLKREASEGRPAVDWLRWHVYGGLRTATAFENALIRGGAMREGMRAVPATRPGSAARFDAFGNISRGQLQQILSQLRIETGVQGSTRAMTQYAFQDTRRARRDKGNRMRRAYGRAGGQFVAFPNGRGKLRPGVYLVEGRDFGARVGYGKTGRLRPVLIFVSRAQYEAGRFDFHYVAEKVVRRDLMREVTGAVVASMLRLQQVRGGSAP